MPDNESNFDKAFLEDVVKEDNFLEQTKELDKTDAKPVSELEVMTAIYKEQLDGMMRSRFDVEIFAAYIFLEPNDKTHADSKLKAELNLKKRRKNVGIIRNQIIQHLKKHE